MLLRTTKQALLLSCVLSSIACIESEGEQLELTDEDPDVIALEQADRELLAPTDETEAASLELPTINCVTTDGVGVCEYVENRWISVDGSDNADYINIHVRRDYSTNRVYVRVEVNWSTWESTHFPFDPQDPSDIEMSPVITVDAHGGDDDVYVDYSESFDGVTWQTGVPNEHTTAHGGSGDDFLDGFREAYGGTGSDFIACTSAADYVEGDSGADTIYVYDGDDVVYGEGGADEIHGGSGNNMLDGGDGKDWLLGGGVGVDRLYGGADNDHLFGYGANDILRGQAGDDVLDGGNGIDDCDGGGGNDSLDNCE